MADTPNQSISKRCFSLTEQIKKRTKNCDPLPSIIITTNIPSIKRSSFIELDTIRTARSKSYTNWPHFTPNGDVMSANGWFYTNIHDRTICVYCHTICHQWTNTDDPQEVHQRLAPQCPFVLSMSSSIHHPSITNQSTNVTCQPHHSSMHKVSCRLKTFDNPSWTQTSPSPADLAQAGFFFAGSGNTVTCFYCNGSLHKWGDTDNPKIEHGRWFPHCLYARHLCGDRLHEKIQITKKQLSKKNTDIDKDMLCRLVAARLDLPFVQRLREQYRLSIIKRCIEEQLKNHQDDFACDNDLAMACYVLQKQVDTIQGKSDKIIVPSQDRMSMNTTEPSKIKLEECLVCLTDERQIACMPCGHLCTCVPCGYSLRSCPMCRQQIQSFVRIYC